MTKLISRFYKFFLALKREPRKKTPPAESDCKRDYDGNNCVHWSPRLRILRPIFGVCLGVLLCAGLAHATTYYIAASGVDSNNGTSETTPWLHAPGMTNCASVCAGVTPAAGDSFIFRGGDAWHRSASTSDTSDVPMGGAWTWSWSGSGLGSTCNYVGGATSTCIYIGVDTTWYNSSVCGSSFCRPQLEMDNPIWANSTLQDSANPGFVTGCTFPDNTSSSGSGISGMAINATGVVFDNFNVWGMCWTGVYSATGCQASYIYTPNTVNGYLSVIHSYFHGWTETYNPQTDGGTPMDQCSVLGGGGAEVATHTTIAYDVFDGTDSCPYATAGYELDAQPRCTGGPVKYGDCYNFFGNVVRYIANGCNPGENTVLVHDNLFEEMWESYDPADHGAIMEAANPPADALPANQSWYNNTVRNGEIGTTFETDVLSGYTLYAFNNVFYNITHGGNCWMADSQSSTGSYYFTNNTFIAANSLDSSTCQIRTLNSNSATLNFQNNQLIGYTNCTTITTSCSLINQSFATLSDAGNEVNQTASQASSQGYTASNNYQPTASGNATIHAGGNLSTSCTTYSSDSALCNGSTGGVTNTAGSGAVPALYIASPPARGTTFDSGAYQFSGVAPSTPVAPAPWFAELTSLPFRVWL